ncbi:hypothetical protein Tco_0509483 [Tanacetum coccineum]
MITTDSRIEDKKPSELILPPMDILETFPCVKDVDYITRDLAVSSVRISTLETTLEDIQVHQNLLQSENPNHQATILVIRCLLPTALLSVSSDYFPASAGSSSFNFSENAKDNIIPPVFSSFYNNPCLKNVQAFYAKELPISSPDLLASKY